MALVSRLDGELVQRGGDLLLLMVLLCSDLLADIRLQTLVAEVRLAQEAVTLSELAPGRMGLRRDCRPGDCRIGRPIPWFPL